MLGKRFYIRIIYACGIVLVIYVVWILLASTFHNGMFRQDDEMVDIDEELFWHGWKPQRYNHRGNNPPSEYDRNNAFMQHCEDDVMYLEPKLRILPEILTQKEITESASINCTLGRIMSEGVVFPICIYNTQNDSSISGMLVHGKQLFEEENIRSIAQWLKQLNDAAFVDIGANIGLYTNMAAQLGYNVLAVEPRPENVLRMRKALQMRNLQKRVTIIQNAVSDIRSRMNLLTHRTEQGRTIVVCNKDCQTSNSESCLSEKVDTILMDDLVYAANFSKAVMKIDVEGHEIKAFSSSQYFFEKIRVPVILMEWDWRQRFQSRYNKDREVVQRFIDMLLNRRYRPQDSQGSVLRPEKWDTWPVDVHWVLYNALG